MASDSIVNRDDAVRITDLGAPAIAEEHPPAAPAPRARRRQRALAVVALLCLAGAAYSATAAPTPRPGLPPDGSPGGPVAGAPLDVCSVHPGACAQPDRLPGSSPDTSTVRDARVRFLPDDLTGTTGSVIICEPATGACRPMVEKPTACDVVASLRAGLGRLPQEVASDIALPDGQSPLVVVGPAGVISPVGIAYADGTAAVCGPLQVPYVEGGAERVQAIAADDAVGGLDPGETYAYRFDDAGRLDLVGVRSADGTVTPRG